MRTNIHTPSGRRFRVWTAGAILALSLVPLAASPAAAEAVPTRIDPTGAKDVTSDFLAYFASVPDGSTIVFPEKARYRVEGMLRLFDRRNLTFEGNQSVIFATTKGAETRRHLSFRGGANITIRNLEVIGAHPNPGTYVSAYESQHGFELSGVNGALLQGVRASKVYGDFVYVGDDPRNRNVSRNVTIQDSVFERSGRQGITGAGVDGLTILRNRISGAAHVTFDFEPIATDVFNVRILDNTAGPAGNAFVSAMGNGRLRDLSVIGNTLEGAPMRINVASPSGSTRSGIRILNNVSRNRVWGGNYGSGMIRFTRVVGAEVRGNTASLDPTRNLAGVSLSASCATVAENRFEGAARDTKVVNSVPC